MAGKSEHTSKTLRARVCTIAIPFLFLALSSCSPMLPVGTRLEALSGDSSLILPRTSIVLQDFPDSAFARTSKGANESWVWKLSPRGKSNGQILYKYTFAAKSDGGISHQGDTLQAEWMSSWHQGEMQYWVKGRQLRLCDPNRPTLIPESAFMVWRQDPDPPKAQVTYKMIRQKGTIRLKLLNAYSAAPD
jgi:hypothetical protein